MPFVAWFAGLPSGLAQYPVLGGAGLLATFGSINTAIPFLLDLVRIPADLFQLFVVAGVLNSRFGSMAAAMHTLVIAVLGTSLITGRVRFHKARLLRYAVLSTVLVAVLPGGHSPSAGTRAARARHPRAGASPRSCPSAPFAPTTTFVDLPPPPDPTPARGTRLASIRSNGRLRVGFDPDYDSLGFLNGAGTPVGFDTELAHQLAFGLGVRLEHVVGEPGSLRGSAGQRPSSTS